MSPSSSRGVLLSPQRHGDLFTVSSKVPSTPEAFTSIERSCQIQPGVSVELFQLLGGKVREDVPFQRVSRGQ